jgi:hypothetical protein
MVRIPIIATPVREGQSKLSPDSIRFGHCRKIRAWTLVGSLIGGGRVPADS